MCRKSREGNNASALLIIPGRSRSRAIPRFVLDRRDGRAPSATAGNQIESGALRLTPAAAAQATRAIRSARRRAAMCGHATPSPGGGIGTGSGLVQRRRRDEREHEGKGRFHWFDLCLGHYWDTAAISR